MSPLRHSRIFMLHSEKALSYSMFRYINLEENAHGCFCFDFSSLIICQTAMSDWARYSSIDLLARMQNFFISSFD